MALTRGERNRNPGNLERNGIPWRGMADEQPDPRFITFGTPVMGIRALATVLLTYYRKHKLCTVRQIIGRWAPPNENNTAAYAACVANDLLCTPDEDLQVDDPAVLLALTRAIIRHENGRCIYQDDILEIAVGMALRP